MLLRASRRRVSTNLDNLTNLPPHLISSQFPLPVLNNFPSPDAEIGRYFNPNVGHVRKLTYCPLVQSDTSKTLLVLTSKKGFAVLVCWYVLRCFSTYETTPALNFYQTVRDFPTAEQRVMRSLESSYECGKSSKTSFPAQFNMRASKLEPAKSETSKNPSEPFQFWE